MLLLSGPNLNLLGEREPDVYGAATLEDHVATARMTAKRVGLELEALQSNREGDLVEAIHAARARCAAIVINAGALTHYAWSLHDALSAFDGPVVELHLSNPNAREPWRHTSVVAPDELVLATDGRYQFQSAEQLRAAGVEATIEIGNLAGQQKALAEAGRSLRRLGLEAAHVSWARQRAFASEWFSDAELVPTEGVVEGLRRVKDAGEIARLALAAAIADEALAAVRPQLRERPSERDVALELDYRMRRLGAEGPSFDTIVASGPNGAKPHARPSDRAIGGGELVVIDFGALVDGYHSDMTRSF